MSTKINSKVKIEDGKVFFSKDLIPQQSGLQQNVFGVPSLVGFFFDGFGAGKTLNNVEVGWFANGDGVVNAVVTNVNPANQTIAIQAGHGVFQSGRSYRFYNTRQ